MPGHAADEALGAIGARAVNEGANLTIIDTKSSSELLFRQRVGVSWLAVSFTCLKAFAFDQRFERKDAHDLTYCIEHAPGAPDSVAAVFREALAGKHGPVVRQSLSILRRRFAGEDAVEGFRKDGPVAVARFEKGEGGEPELREARLLRQREVSDVVERLLALLQKEREI